MTKMAAKILTVIQGSAEHLTADGVYAECKKRGVKCSVASVYRNLSSLARDGLIQRLSIAGEPDRFDKTLTEHEHLICEKCGRISDVRISGLKELLEKKAGAKINSYDLCMRYICGECRGKK